MLLRRLAVKNVFLCNELIDGFVQQLALMELDLYCESGFSDENLKKLKNATSYKSAAYFDALKNIH